MPVRVRSHRLDSLTDEQRRIVLGASIILMGNLTLSASFNYMLNDMVSDLGATEDQSAFMRQLSSIGSLLVVFLAGVLGMRLGERRVLMGSSVLFAAGSVIVCLSPDIAVASVGLLLANVAKAIIAVVGIAYVTVSIRDRAGRATAFSAVSSVQPLGYLVIPVMAGLLVSGLGWRVVSALWILGGVAAFLAARRLLPKDGTQERMRGELLTPALAGLALAMFVQLVGTVRQGGITPQFWIELTIAGGAILALVILYRGLKAPSLSLRPLRHGGLMLLLLVVVLMSFVNLYYYATELFQVVYGYSALGAAVLMAPAQVAGIISAVVVRRVLQRRGITYTGTLALSLTALTLFMSATLHVDSPVIVPVIVVSLYGFASLGALITLTNAVMDLSRSGDEGDTSSYRSAAANIGIAIGITVMTFVMTTAGFTSLNAQLDAAGIAPAEVSNAGWDLLYGADPQEVSDQYAIPIDEVNEISAAEQVAYVDAYRAQGLVAGIVTSLSAMLFFLIRRRGARGAEDVSQP